MDFIKRIIGMFFSMAGASISDFWLSLVTLIIIAAIIGFVSAYIALWLFVELQLTGDKEVDIPKAVRSGKLLFGLVYVLSFVMFIGAGMFLLV